MPAAVANVVGVQIFYHHNVARHKIYVEFVVCMCIHLNIYVCVVREEISVDHIRFPHFIESNKHIIILTNTSTHALNITSKTRIIMWTDSVNAKSVEIG
jgi:hypothetical protein